MVLFQEAQTIFYLNKEEKIVQTLSMKLPLYINMGYIHTHLDVSVCICMYYIAKAALIRW